MGFLSSLFFFTNVFSVLFMCKSPLSRNPSKERVRKCTSAQINNSDYSVHFKKT